MNENVQSKESQTKKLVRRPYPRFSLEETLILSTAIQDKNAGKPMNRLLLADAIGRKPTSTEYRDLLSCSYKYGLTEGTEKAENISLTDLGQKLTIPTSTEEETKAKQQATLNPEVFKRIYSHYKNGKFPSAGSFFENTLERQFQIPREYTKELEILLSKNGKFAGLIRNISGSEMIMFENYSIPENHIEKEENDQDGVVEDLQEMQAPLEDKSKEEKTEGEKPRPIFIAHGKNTKPLDQLKKILEEFKLEYRVAIDEPHTGRPISQKVRDIMHECGSAIFIFSKEGENTTETGETMPNLNVVFELGAASVLYGEKVVVFKEDGLKFSSDFDDLGHIAFETDKLDAQAMNLLKELIAMGFLKITSA